MSREVYTLGEAAKVLAVNPVTVWRWINSGKMESYQIGREVLIEKAIVDEIRRAELKG